MRSLAEIARVALVLETLAFGGVAARTAFAADPPRAVLSTREANQDTTYGRIEGDVAFVLGAGVTVAPRGPRGVVDLRVRYLETIGLFVDYEDAPLLASASDPRRVFSGGLELRPLFLARWLTGNETTRGRFDLTLDSAAFELGGAVIQPTGASFSPRPAMQVGLGVEVPILAQATGPWIGIHGGIRWSDAALSDGRVDAPADRAAYLSLTLAWHQLVMAHVVDAGDVAPR